MYNPGKPPPKGEGGEGRGRGRRGGEEGGGKRGKGGREEEERGRREGGKGGVVQVVMHTAGGDSPWGGLFTMSTTVETVLEGQLIWGGVERGRGEGGRRET